MSPPGDGAEPGPGLAAVRSLPVFKSVEGHFHEVPFFLTREMFGGLPIELAGGDISGLVGKPVADVHAHACDEIYFLVAPEPGAAVIDVEVEGRVTTFESPAAILVPAGARHRFLTRKAGTGSFCFGILLATQARAVACGGGAT
jgi:mannose-6-phosphate isomerase-like protein (cupin superfamily)